MSETTNSGRPDAADVVNAYVAGGIEAAVNMLDARDAAIRKEAVAEFVRLLACEMCPACMHGNAWRKGLEYLEHTGMGPCRVITPCDAAGLWEFAREKGIDL